MQAVLAQHAGAAVDLLRIIEAGKLEKLQSGPAQDSDRSSNGGGAAAIDIKLEQFRKAAPTRTKTGAREAAKPQVLVQTRAFTQHVATRTCCERVLVLRRRVQQLQKMEPSIPRLQDPEQKQGHQ